MTIKHIAGLMGLVFAITLAVVLGKQMSAEAMAVVVGVVCGVAAGIPASILLLVVLTRRDRQRLDEAERQVRQQNYPPVVVVQGGAAQPMLQSPQAGYWPTPSPEPAFNRQFNVVGGEDLLLDDGRY